MGMGMGMGMGERLILSINMYDGDYITQRFLRNKYIS